MKRISTTIFAVLSLIGSISYGDLPSSATGHEKVQTANFEKIKGALADKVSEIVAFDKDLELERYEVVIKLTASLPIEQVEAQLKIRVERVLYSRALARLTAGEILILSANPLVKFVETNGSVDPLPAITTHN